MSRSQLPLNALRAFEAAARHASFTHAAEELHVTQAAGCLVIANTSAEADRLVSAHCPLAERTEIHGIKVVGPDIKMALLADGLPIPPGYTTTLKPRGYHLLLQGLRTPLASGTRLPVTLSFEKAGEIAVELVAREPGLVGEAILNEEHHR